MRFGAISAFVGVMMTATGTLAAELPPAVQQSVDGLLADCRQMKETPKFNKGFLTRRDINADGVEDFILDYGAFSCGTMSSLYCGSAGCTTNIFASLPGGGYVEVLNSNVYKVEFKTVKNRPAMLLTLHGSACGKIGAEACNKTAIWNGKTFASGR